jgi:NitT/TauT family transport system permease protein
MLRAGVVALAVVVVEVWTRSIPERYVIIPPSTMVRALAWLLVDQSFWADVQATLIEVSLSFALATAFGFAIGVALGLRPTLYTVIEPYLMAYYANPIFVFYPVLISFFGLTAIPIIIIASLASVIGIVVNTAIGVKRVKPVYRKVGQTLGMSFGHILLRIYFPCAVPHIFTGLRLGLVYAFLATITSEFLLAPRGLGYFIKFQYEAFQAQQMYGAILLAVTVAISGNALLARIENRLYNRRLEAI